MTDAPAFGLWMAAASAVGMVVLALARALRPAAGVAESEGGGSGIVPVKAAEA